MKKHPVIQLIVIAFLVVLIPACVAVYLYYTHPSTHVELWYESGQSVMYKTPSNFSQETILPPLGIMIENELMSRPYQRGLSHADIVYEAPTEGGITRFLGLFSPLNAPAKIGPIRSARTYFLDWIHEYNGVYVHVGGNADVLARLRREEIYNADQFVYEKYFKRENVGRVAFEHTMFTTGEKIRQLVLDNRWVWEKPPRLPILISKEKADFSNYPTATTLSIDFGISTYKVSYRYDSQLKQYFREQGEKPHIDHATNAQISVAAVIIQSVQWRSNFDSEGSISLTTIGEGKAVMFYKGRVIEGSWKKDALKEPTRFFDADGKEVRFGETPVWVEVLPVKNTTFTYE